MKSSPHAAQLAQGARCDLCPLRTDGKGPCSSELLPNTTAIVVSQEPGSSELEADRPLAGRAGRLFDKALAKINKYRPEVSATHVVACTPPGGDIRAYEARLRTKNAKRVAAGQAPIPLPTVCCAPRLHRDLSPFLHVLPLGAIAGSAVMAHFKGGIAGNRGRIVATPSNLPDPRPTYNLQGPSAAFEQGLDIRLVPGRRIVPTYHPSFILREPEEWEVFVGDISRAFRWWSAPDDSGLAWTDPVSLFRPDVATIEAALVRRTHPFEPMHFAGVAWHAFDFETDGIDPITANVRCLGIGTDRWAMTIPFAPVSWARITRGLQNEAVRRRKILERSTKNPNGLTQSEAIAAALEAVSASIGPSTYPRHYVMDDGSTLPMYEPQETAYILDVLAWWAADTSIRKTGWNSGAYDRLKWEHWTALLARLRADGRIQTLPRVSHAGPLSMPHPIPHDDGILYKRNVRSHLPNTLDFVGSHWSDVHNWKGDHAATTAKTDEHLGRYCNLDVVVDARVFPALYTEAHERGHLVPNVPNAKDPARPISLVELDHRTQSGCVELTRAGMWIDQVERSRLDIHLASPGKATTTDKNGKTVEIPCGSIQRWMLRARRVLQSTGVDLADIARRTAAVDRRNEDWRQAQLDTDDVDGAREQDPDGDQDGMILPSAAELNLDTLAFNPLSHPQLRAVLFEDWDLPHPTDMKEKELYTSSGEVSTGDAVLRRLYTDPRVSPEQREFIRAVRMARRHAKMWGTFVRPFRLPTGDRQLDKGCRVWSDGRVHASWTAHVAITGRLACSGPNLMNIPLLIRAMMCAQPRAPTSSRSGKMVLVGADMDQLEFRIAAGRWGAKDFITAFSEGLDAYQVTMRSIFGTERMERYEGKPAVFGSKKFGKPSQFERQRKLAKATHLASQYAAGCAIRDGRPTVVDLATIFRMLTSAEDKETGELEFADLKMGEVELIHAAWLSGCSEYVEGWTNEWRTARAQGYLVEPITGRRRDFGSEVGAPSLNEVVNFPVQCVPAHVRVITSRGYLPIGELEGLTFAAWTGHRWAPATCVRKGRAVLREVRTHQGLRLVCDDTHKFKVPDRSEYVWKTADTLICNQRVALDMAQPLEFGQAFDAEDAYAIGLFLADGSATYRNRGHGRSVTVAIVVGNTAASGPETRCGPEQVDRLLAWGQRRGFCPRQETGQGCPIVAFDQNAALWLENVGLSPGLKARSKRVPECIWRANLEARSAFLRGILDGDGYQNPDGGIVLGLFNPELLEDVAVLARTCGIAASRLAGPYATNSDGEHVVWRLMLPGEHVHRYLGWGRPCKFRSNETVPQFECLRVLPELKPFTASHRTIKSRIRGHAGAAGTSCYTLRDMGASRLYDHATVTSASSTGYETDVFTLCVDDPDHQYVAEGFIAKNSSAAALMNLVLDNLVTEIPFGAWGPGTGVINQCHDAITIECPEEDAAEVHAILERVMTRREPSLPDMTFTTDVKTAYTAKDPRGLGLSRWSET